MARRPRLAVIGAGAWGINHIRVLAASVRCELVAVVDPDPRTPGRVAALAPERWTPELAPVLADRSIDAVVIASPAATHAAIAEAALLADKHVLIEKPLALRLSEARQVAAVAERSNRVALVGHLMLYHPAVVRLRELVREGSLGRVHYLHATRANLGQLRRDENALWSFGPHDLSMLDYLLDRQPVNVTARGQCVLQAGIEDVVFLTLRYGDGAMAYVHLSWLHPRKERRLTIVCEHKMIEFDDVSSEKLRIYDKGFDRPPPFTQFAEYLTLRNGDVHIPSVAMDEPLRLELEHFLDCIAGTARPRTPVSNGVRVVQVLDAAQRSLSADGVPMVCAT